MNHPDTTLKDCIHIEKGIIPEDMCDYIVEEIENKEWKPHTWYDNADSSYITEKTKALDIQPITSEFQQLLSPILLEVTRRYCKKFVYPAKKTQGMVSTMAPVRFNRYKPGQMMRVHHDHIHDIFDGVHKGIPVLSYILNFNEDYEGAKLFFWDDYELDLGVGDITIWPSPFLWPHGVTEATKGTRYSGVCWGW